MYSLNLIYKILIITVDIITANKLRKHLAKLERLYKSLLKEVSGKRGVGKKDNLVRKSKQPERNTRKQKKR